MIVALFVCQQCKREFEKTAYTPGEIADLQKSIGKPAICKACQDAMYWDCC